MAATAVRAKGKKSTKYVRVGQDHASEQELRSRLRGNTGSGNKPELGMLPDGLPISSTAPDGYRRTFLPSENWIDIHFFESLDSVDGEEISIRNFYQSHPRSPLNWRSGPQMLRCRQCGHLTPEIAVETPLSPHRPLNQAMELLCAVPIASPTPTWLLAEDFPKLGHEWVVRTLSWARQHGVLLRQGNDGETVAWLPRRARARFIQITEGYWISTRQSNRRRASYKPVCMDCRNPKVHRSHGRSPSGHAIEKLEYYNNRIEQLVLATEDTNDLRRDCRRVESGYWSPVE